MRILNVLANFKKCTFASYLFLSKRANLPKNKDFDNPFNSFASKDAPNTSLKNQM